MADFKLTARQAEAQELLNGSAKHILLAGGSRSGKTMLIIRKQVQRRLKAPGSRGAVLRFRFGHVKQSVVHDTFPKTMALCFPGVRYEVNRSDWFATFPGGSELWFGGLDDKERTEKILGTEFADIFLNECSQIPYTSRNMAVTRVAQKVHDRATGRDLPLKMYYDENPPDKGHWTYQLFKLFREPGAQQQVERRDFAFLQLNPKDNEENLPPEYLAELAKLPARMRRRFFEGEFRDVAPGALFSEEIIERWRVIDEQLPDMLRIVVAVDPSGAEDEDNFDNDEIGIVVCGLGVDGNGYVLEDLTCKVAPERWGGIAVQAYERHRADRIVGEVNYGGAMVGAVIRAAAAKAGCRVPYRAVTATRGKAVRAEPISALMEDGKIRLAGVFRALEDELCAMTTHGYAGENSPNRADAMVWGMSDLFPDLTKEPAQPKVLLPPPFAHRRSPNAWMRQ